MSAHDHFDIAIVGAGAAGLAAAAALRAQPLRVVLMEARDRLGGRAHTLQPEGLFPLDAGCGWLHSADRNVLAPLIEAAGLAIDRARPHWERQSANRHFSAADRRAFREAHDGFEARLEAGGADRRRWPGFRLVRTGRSLESADRRDQRLLQRRRVRSGLGPRLCGL